MAMDMATKNYFSHTDSLGRTFDVRISNCGGVPSAENIAAGVQTAPDAFNTWRNSAAHDTAMRNASYRQIGIARYYVAGSSYGWYWVTDFSATDDGTRVGGTPPPDGSTFYVAGNASVYLMQNGLKRYVPNPATLACWPAPIPVASSVAVSINAGAPLQDREGCTASLIGAPTDGTLVKGIGDSAVYLIQAGVRRWVPNLTTLSCWPGAVQNMNLAYVQSLLVGPNLADREGCTAANAGVPPNGTLVQGLGRPEIWLMQNGQKRYVPNMSTAACWPGGIHIYGLGYVQSIPTGRSLADREGC